MKRSTTVQELVCKGTEKRGRQSISSIVGPVKSVMIPKE